MAKLHCHTPACPCSQKGAGSEKSSPWGVLLPVLACALCPACVTTYAKLFSVFGVGMGLSETAHFALLLVAIGASLGLSAWRAVRSRRLWPVAIAFAGAALVVAGHVTHQHWLEWPGILTLLAGGLVEHFRLRRSPAILVHA